MDDSKEWVRHFMARSGEDETADRSNSKFQMILLKKGKILVSGGSREEPNVISPEESALQQRKAELKNDPSAKHMKVELTDTAVIPDGLKGLHNKNGVIMKRKMDGGPVTRELSKIKKRDIFSDVTL